MVKVRPKQILYGTLSITAGMVFGHFLSHARQDVSKYTELNKHSLHSEFVPKFLNRSFCRSSKVAMHFVFTILSHPELFDTALEGIWGFEGCGCCLPCRAANRRPRTMEVVTFCIDRFHLAGYLSRTLSHWTRLIWFCCLYICWLSRVQRQAIPCSYAGCGRQAGYFLRSKVALQT